MISSSAFAKTLTLSAIATLLALSGCNPFQNTPESPQQKTPTVVTPEPPNPWRQPQLLRSLDTDSTPIISITISPDSKNIVASSFSGDGQILASTSRDQTIKIWNVATGQLIQSFNGNFIKVLAIAPNNQFLVTGDQDGQVQIWQVDQTK